jgi:hypothetical protein
MSTVTIINATTGETIVRDMTDAELAQKALDDQRAEAEKQEIAAYIAAKESAKAKLAALGLTDDEINALIGY